MSNKMPNEIWVEDDAFEIVDIEMGYANKHQFATKYIRADQVESAHYFNGDNFAEKYRDAVLTHVTYRGYEHNDDTPTTYDLLKTGAIKALEYLDDLGVPRQPRDNTAALEALLFMNEYAVGNERFQDERYMDFKNAYETIRKALEK